MNEQVPREVPYPGLRPFQKDETHLFFGREDQTDQLLARLENRHFLAVIGASGCGKSSLVRAGLLNGLETGFMASAGARWRFAIMEPDDRPLRNLATTLAGTMSDDDDDPALMAPFWKAALRRGPLALVELLEKRPLPRGENLLLLVDQFEELFRVREEGNVDEAEAFVALLLETARAGQEGRVPIFVVITMRSDYLGDCALFHGLPEAINEGQFLTPQMTRRQKLEAIRGPARVFGGDVERELLNSLLNDLGPDPDQLPLMQHVLSRMWVAGAEELPPGGGGPTLTAEEYRQVGGLKSALSNHLEEAFESLSPEQRGIAEVLFRGLSERSTGGRDVRHPATLGELSAIAGVSEEEMVAVVDVFRARGRSFITPGIEEEIDAETELDISHESLLRQWARVQDWLEDEAASAETYRRLAEAALLWKQGKHSLWSTPNLELALAWREEQAPSVQWAARYFHRVEHTPGATTAEETFELALEFLEASEEEQSRERRRERVRLWRARAYNVALLAAVLVVAWFWSEARVTKFSTAATLAAHEVLEEQPEVALWLTLYAYHLRPEIAKNAQHIYWTLGNMGLPAERTLPTNPSNGVERGVQSLAYDTSGTRLIATQRSQLWRWQFNDLESVGERIFQADSVLTAVALSPAGVAFVGDEAGRVYRVSVDTGESLELRDTSLPVGATTPMPAHPGGVHAVALSPDGLLLATAGDDDGVKVWSVTGDGVKLERTLSGPTAPVLSLAFSPESSAGYRLATGDENRQVLLWDVDSGRSVQVGTAKADFVRAVAFGQRRTGDGPLETVLAYGDDQGGVALWRLNPDGTPAGSVWTCKVSGARIRGVGFGPRGDRLALASDDLHGYLLTLDAGFQVVRSEDRGCESEVLPGHRGWVMSVEFSPNGRSVATGSMDGTVKVWKAENGSSELAQRVIGGDDRHTDRLRGMAFSWTDTVLATTSDDGTVALWDYSDKTTPPVLKSKRRIPMPDGSTLSRGVSAAFSHDGKRLAVASLEGNIATIWSVEGDTLAPEPIDTLRHNNWVWDVEFSPDDSLFATASADGLARFWSLRGDSLVLEFELDGHEGQFVMDVTFSPNFAEDHLVATAGRDGSAVVWRLSPGRRDTVFRAPHLRDVRAVAFSPDGRTLATAGDDKTVRLWDVSSGDQIDVLAHDEVVWSVAFDSSGRLLASSGYDGLVHLWDVGEPGHPLRLELEVGERTQNPADVRLGRVAFSPVQNVVGVGSWNASGYLYMWNAEEVERSSWRLLTRAMTDLDCERHLAQSKCDRFFSRSSTDSTRMAAPFAQVWERTSAPSGDPR